jgi:SAM-dependent methyltransferase
LSQSVDGRVADREVRRALGPKKMNQLTRAQICARNEKREVIVKRLDQRTAELHLVEMRRNKKAWEKKPLLHVLYGQFYTLIRENLAAVPGLIVELGSGIGAVKAFIPQCISTDIFPNPWIDRRENAYALKFPSGAVSNLILLDVFHHLQFPGTALNEFWRVLADGGRLILVEPGMGILGKIIYGLFHHEPLGSRKPITWFAPAGFDSESAGYYAAQCNATRIFLGNEFPEELARWRAIRVQQVSDFAYVASGGFSKPQLYPSAILPLIRRFEEVFASWPQFSTTRLLIVAEKKME